MKILGILLLTFSFAGFIHAEDKPLKEGVACPVKATDGCDGSYCSGKVKQEVFAEHSERKVYFCCKGCIKAFEKNPNTYIAKVKEQWELLDEEG